MVRTKKASYAAPESLRRFPIQELPVELLSKIFIHCLNPTGLEAYFIGAHPRSAPMLLTQVCSRWRKCALDTPQLWCSLDLTERTIVNSVNVTQIRFTSDLASQVAGLEEMWFGRAKILPLSLALRLRTQLAPHFDKASLHSHFSRCTVLSLSMFEPVCILGLTSSVLDELEVTCFYPSRVSGPPMHAPRLRKLTLGGYAEWTVGQLDFLLPHLQELVWRGAMEDERSSQRFLEILRRCRALTRCSAIVPSRFRGLTISMPNLAQLEIRVLVPGVLAPEPEASLDPFLSILHIPSLSHLTLSSTRTYENGTLGVQFLILMLLRSSCSLTHLTICLKDVVSASAMEFSTFLQAMPGLEELKMHGYFRSICGWGSTLCDLFKCLTYGFAGTETLPNLRRLDIEIPWAAVFYTLPSVDVVEAMLRSRTEVEGRPRSGGVQPSAYLRSVSIGSCTKPSGLWTSWWFDGIRTMRKIGDRDGDPTCVIP
ncbi:hypothetical protein OE88DRAFT_1662433 [Heliocybe sulcata]|uniref:Uncharacterized protein n=1 Tax=Heliocybe sulcata TaxID=5364 RepID=A0A5C3N160_9AGAM|nr:hypothetical protein OE88DRAFT_1662433 [Heliocybe sulcata]